MKKKNEYFVPVCLQKQLHGKNFSDSEPINFIDYVCNLLADAIIGEFEKEEEHYKFAKKKRATGFEVIPPDLDLSKLPEDYFYNMVIENLDYVLNEFSKEYSIRNNIDDLWENVLTKPKYLNGINLKSTDGLELIYKEKIIVNDYNHLYYTQQRPIQKEDIIFAINCNLKKIPGYDEFNKSFNNLSNKQYINEISKRFSNYYIWLDTGNIENGIRHIFHIKREYTSHFIEYPIPNGLDRTIMNVLINIYNNLLDKSHLYFEPELELCNGGENFSLIHEYQGKKIKNVIEVCTGRIVTCY